MPAHLSVRGRPTPVVGAPLRYRATASPYEAAMLRLGLGDLVLALDWYTEDPQSGDRILHILSVPRTLAESVGLELEDLTGFDAVLDILDAAGRPVRESYERDGGPISDGRVALALGLSPGASLRSDSQLLYDQDREPLLLEVTHSAWSGQ